MSHASTVRSVAALALAALLAVGGMGSGAGAQSTGGQLPAPPPTAAPGGEHAGHAPGAAAAPGRAGRGRALGRVVWPNTGAAAAQAPFLQGIALLHNFHYDEAAADFRRAQAADPAFALPYWAEALSYSAVFWGYESLDSSRTALARLGATPAALLARARTADERAFGTLVEAFYADGPLPVRARAAADAGRRWAAAAPRAEEPAAFAALTVMMQGYATPGPASDSLLAEAAGYAQRLFDANPRHPGAAHYLIHAWDRPATAARGLAAARAYDGIAPDAEHALHMPSHIYYQLGMWADMARSNERAWPASRRPGAIDTAATGSPHALEWLQYAYLQQGRWREARALVDTARRLWSGRRDFAAAPDAAHAAAFLAFRYGADTGDWSLWPAAIDSLGARGDAVAGPHGAPPSARAAGMGLVRAYHEAAGALLARGDTAPARRLSARLAARADAIDRMLADRMPAAGTWTSAAFPRALAAQLDGLVAQRRGDQAGARAAFARAAALAPGGGPSIPAALSSRELLAASQLAAGDARAAAASYDSALAAFPGRSALLLGLTRARAASGDAAGAADAQARLDAHWTHADGRRPASAGDATRRKAYDLVQQGRVRAARALVDSVLAQGRGAVDAQAVAMVAAYVVDAEAWDTPLAQLRLDTTRLPGVADRTAADFLVGYAAARRAGRPVDVVPGSRAADRLLADTMLVRMAARHAAARGAAARDAHALGTALDDAEGMAQLVRAELAAGAGRVDSAVALLRAAAGRRDVRPSASGLPPTFKSPHERAGELLLFTNRPAEALAELDSVSRATPGRTLATLRRARALAALGRRDEAARTYATLDSIWQGADATFPYREEARVGSGAFAAALARGLAGGPAAVDTVAYASGALRLRGVVYRPAGGGRHPAIVALHGSDRCWRPTEDELLGRLFAARGYVTFLPCRRGLGLSAGQGEAVMDQLRREGMLTRDSAYAARSTELLGTTQLADVRAAVAAIRARADVDPARVAVTGISYGGILTLLAAEADTSLRAAVAFAPAAMNWAWNAPLRERLTNAARRTRVPTFVVQAENDWNVGPTTALPAAMRAGGGDAAGRLYPAIGQNAGEGHGLMVTAPALWQGEVFAFLDRHVGAPGSGAARTVVRPR